jgi:thiol:disulfide interchange protein DsbD
MKKLTFLFVALIISAVTAMAQSPIKWRTTYKMTSQTEGVLTVKAIVTEGWHLYGTELPEGGPKATSLARKALSLNLHLNLRLSQLKKWMKCLALS